MYKAVIFDMYETLVTVFRERPYYSAQMACDAGVDTALFRKYWRSYEDARTVGKCDLETALGGTLKSLDVYTDELYRMMHTKRLADQKRIFSVKDERITGMLERLRSRGVLLGLISNCYFEERDMIRASHLCGYFDHMALSCELGIKKPDPAIFESCLAGMGISPSEALYAGDGGSSELEAATSFGLTAVQACWYINEDEPDKACGRKPGFYHAEDPGDIVRIVNESV